MILATIIRIIHLMIIAFILVAPFSNLAPLIILNITGCLSLLVHWHANNDICCLSLLEAKLRGIDYTQGFLHQFVSPVYKITDAQISKIAFYVVIISMLLSIYNLLNTKAFEKAKKCYENNGQLLDCIKILFQNNV